MAAEAPVGRRARPRRVRHPDHVPRLRKSVMDEKRDDDARGAEPRARPGAGRPTTGCSCSARTSPIPAHPARPRGCRRSTATTACSTRPISEAAIVGAAIGAAIDGHAAGRRDHDHGLHRHRRRPADQQRREAALHDGGPDDRADHRAHPGLRRAGHRRNAFAVAGGVVHARAGDEGDRAVHPARR